MRRRTLVRSYKRFNNQDNSAGSKSTRPVGNHPSWASICKDLSGFSEHFQVGKDQIMTALLEGCGSHLQGQLNSGGQVFLELIRLKLNSNGPNKCHKIYKNKGEVIMFYALLKLVLNIYIKYLEKVRLGLKTHTLLKKTSK